MDSLYHENQILHFHISWFKRNMGNVPPELAAAVLAQRHLGRQFTQVHRSNSDTPVAAPRIICSTVLDSVKRLLMVGAPIPDLQNVHEPGIGPEQDSAQLFIGQLRFEFVDTIEEIHQLHQGICILDD